VQAAGVQLGERSFQVADARLVLDEHVIVGRSIHDLEGALGAAEAGADYLLAGHIFDTPSKAGTPGRGLDWLAEVTASVATPVIALGGITRERIPQVLEAGAHGVAVGRELLQAGNTSAAAAQARGLLA
jgi:thiazole tautomerase (transcriptional regulator TenI)